MDVQDEPQLFGAAPGELVNVSLSVGLGSERTIVALHAMSMMRQRPMSLTVRIDGRDGVNQVVGALTPAIIRSGRMSAAMLRRMLWALHDRLGEDGYEVSIVGCGRQTA